MSIQISRRGLLAAGTAAAFVPPGLSFAAAKAPVAKLTPVTETLAGVSLTDPYRWMENTDMDPDWVPYMKGQNDHARAVFDAIPGRDKLAARVSELTGESAITRRVVIAGPWVFLQERPVGANSFQLVVRQGLDGAPRVLIDPNAVQQDGAHVSLDWWQPSDDGARVVYGLSKAGSEDSVIHVMETATATVLPLRIPRAQYASPAWLPDGSGFTYNQLGTAELKPSDPQYFLRSKCRLHRLGTDPANDPVVFAQGQQAGVVLPDHEFPVVMMAPGSPHAIAVSIGGVAPELRLWVSPLAALAAGKPVWTPLAEASDQVTSIVLDGDDAFLLTFRDAPRYKVLRTSLKSPNLAAAQTVVPQGDRVIQSIGQARDGLYLIELDGGVGRLRRRDRAGKLTEIALPIEGTLGSPFIDSRQDGVILSTENFATPLRILRVGADGKAVDTGLSPLPPVDMSPFRQTRTFATARDGTKVPITILHRADLRKDGSNPVLIDAYGAYGINADPYFSPRLLPFVELGGVVATVHARGGGEYGREWHLAGKGPTKANTWNDVIAGAEHLIAEGWTRKGKLALEGTSAGGIMATNAMIERPDLFAVIYNRVGASNIVRMAFTPGGPANYPEFGDPGKPDELKALVAMDGYYKIKDGTPYPAVIATAGMTDPRVPPWQGAKFAARTAAASSSGKPVLLRVEFEAGHGIGSTRQQSDNEYADAFAFILWQTGDPRFAVKG